ncbi:hypothetical protein HDU90_007407 [Geranomyces variabilis]|nr:hypothetical protein HDU90_007407 [Geranomyces variabilis]
MKRPAPDSAAFAHSHSHNHPQPSASSLLSDLDSHAESLSASARLEPRHCSCTDSVCDSSSSPSSSATATCSCSTSLLPNPSSASASSSSQQPSLALTATWHGKKHPLTIPSDSTVGDLKKMLADMTGVQPMRQKLMGLVQGKLPADDVQLCELKDVRDGKTFMLMGTVEEKIHTAPETLPEVLNDLDFDFLDYVPKDDSQKNDAKNIASLNEYADKTKITVFNPLREGKKMLVLDLDYTLFDCKTPASHISLLARPGMHEMLTAAYAYYDICIWSQTHWKWLEMKITELGLLTHSAYKIAFVLDRSSMFSITSATRKVDGKPVKHEVKALEIIWRTFPDRFGAHNTCHVDDVSRNFAMNPQQGLKIPAFKNGPESRKTDKVLFPLTRYLLQLALVDDFRKVNHEEWRTFSGPMAQVPEHPPVEDGESEPWNAGALGS